MKRLFKLFFFVGITVAVLMVLTRTMRRRATAPRSKLSAGI